MSRWRSARLRRRSSSACRSAFSATASHRLRDGVLNVLNIVQTIPSIALFGILIAPLGWIAANVPGAAAIGIRGIGAAPAFVALFLYSLLPVVANTVVGLAGVPRAANDAARGIGMTDRQRLFRVEFPLAFPVILTGIRIVLVQNIGLATIAALIGGGGFGVFVFQGIGQTAMDLVLLGAVPTVALAFAAASHPRRHHRTDRRAREREAHDRDRRTSPSATTPRPSSTMSRWSSSRARVLVIVGTSGSGKTTLLRMINRLVEPTSGIIKLDGEDNRTLPGYELRRRIGYAIQGHGLFPHRTVAQNIATVPGLLGWDEEADRRRGSRNCLTLFQLDPAVFGPRYPHELSGGQQQRVGVARALAAEPNVLLMDEPFGALDPIIRAKAQEDLLAIQKRFGTTIILVTHDMEEAIHLGDKIAVMDAGKLVQYATPAEILAQSGDRLRRDAGRQPATAVQAAVAADGRRRRRERHGRRRSRSRPTTNQRDALAETAVVGPAGAAGRRVPTAKPLGRVTVEGLVKRAARPRHDAAHPADPAPCRAWRCWSRSSCGRELVRAAVQAADREQCAGDLQSGQPADADAAASAHGADRDRGGHHRRAWRWPSW